MKQSELRIGFIGVGGIANGKHLPGLSKVKQAKIVAFCDIVKERAEAGAAKYGVPGATVYTDAEKMLATEKLDVVHICTPNDSHAKYAIAALEAGCHVMSEKPMANNAADARRMVETAKRVGKILTVGYQSRYRPDTQLLKKMAEKGEFGDIYYAKALAIRRRAVPTWGVFLNKTIQGGGPLIDIGTHALDLTLWLMNNYEPEYVVGSAYYKLGKRKNAVNAWGPWDPAKFEVEDSAFGFIKMKNGATVSLESSWALNTLIVGEATCILCGTEAGADMMDGLRINGEKLGRLYTQKIETDGTGVAYYDAEGESAGDFESRQWIEAILKGTTPSVKMEQALAVSEILDAIYVSSETGKPVYFDKERELVGV